MRRLVLPLLAALVALTAGAAVPEPSSSATRPGATALRLYLAKMTRINRDYARVEVRGKAAADDVAQAVRLAVGGDRAELERVAAELRAVSTASTAIARRANRIRPAPRTKHPRYVAAVRLAAQAYTVSADGLERLDGTTTARVNRLGAEAKAAIRAWRAAVLAAGRRTRVTVPAWVKRAGT